jgi:hypothetical protein
VSGLPLDALWRRTDALLRRSVPWDASAWGTVDPGDPAVDELPRPRGAAHDPDRELAVFALEHDEREPLRLLELARGDATARQPALATGGRRRRRRGTGGCCGRSARRRPAGRLVRGGVCWGSLYAYRRDGAFTPRRSGCSAPSPRTSPTPCG